MSNIHKTKLFIKTVVANFVTGLILCGFVSYFSHNLSQQFIIGSAFGLISAALSVWLFFKSWCSAPSKTSVIVYHCLRALVVFGSVIIALFVPFFNALATILPHLTTMPLVALFIAFYKNNGGEKHG